MIINFLHHFFLNYVLNHFFAQVLEERPPPPFFRFKHRDKVRFFLEKVIHTIHHIFQIFAGKWPWTLMLRDTYFSFKKLLSVFFFRVIPRVVIRSSRYRLFGYGNFGYFESPRVSCFRIFEASLRNVQNTNKLNYQKNHHKQYMLSIYRIWRGNIIRLHSLYTCNRDTHCLC